MPNLFSKRWCDLAVDRGGKTSLTCAFIGLCLSIGLKQMTEGSLGYIIVESLLLTNFFVLIGSVLVMAGFTIYAVFKRII
jgi:hypothetical protein